MAITEKQLISDLNAGKFAPVYLITGEENYYIDIISDHFEKNIISEEMRDFDQTVIYAKPQSLIMDDILTTAKRFPMMSPVQLVLVKEAQNISDKREWDKLAEYLKKPQPQSVLVFCYRHKKMDKRLAAYKAIDKVGVVYEKNKIRDDEVPAWISNVVKKKGYSITQNAAMMISNAIGNNLGNIANELSKVYIGLAPNAVIDEGVVERQIGISREYNVFELQKAIGRRDVVQCNRIINYMADNPKSNPIQLILPTLYNYFIKVMLYHQVADKSQAASVLKINPYFLRDYETAARNYTLGKLASCIGYLYDTDLRSKGMRRSNNINDSDLLKEMVFKIIH